MICMMVPAGVEGMWQTNTLRGLASPWAYLVLMVYACAIPQICFAFMPWLLRYALLLTAPEYGALTFMAFFITLRSGCAQRAALRESLCISMLTITALGLAVYGFIYVEMCPFLLLILGIVLVGRYPCRIKGAAPSAPSEASLVSIRCPSN
ncbi:uncharacterized protein CIMG_12226 [Coccidioides immitis RS]|uniref:Uncharacterized protein n=1 Tax=Coccidioides immitis (strain RS) TaxID=246410 RepID=A0A0D8JTQ7_COCIM|nr:uncharacterized protein CIMG_12226 [Coccidioides immitis RS]KJF60720.1 hypothetical protein CIMG_12226 [Coccidioides immitis RS]